MSRSPSLTQTLCSPPAYVGTLYVMYFNSRKIYNIVNFTLSSWKLPVLTEWCRTNRSTIKKCKCRAYHFLFSAVCLQCSYVSTFIFRRSTTCSATAASKVSVSIHPKWSILSCKFGSALKRPHQAPRGGRGRVLSSHWPLPSSGHAHNDDTSPTAKRSR